MEIGCPDNSIEALNYAIALGCFASECDVYLTKDDRVIVAHADRMTGLMVSILGKRRMTRLLRQGCLKMASISLLLKSTSTG